MKLRKLARFYLLTAAIVFGVTTVMFLSSNMLATLFGLSGVVLAIAEISYRRGRENENHLLREQTSGDGWTSNGPGPRP